MVRGGVHGPSPTWNNGEGCAPVSKRVSSEHVDSHRRDSSNKCDVCETARNATKLMTLAGPKITAEKAADKSLGMLILTFFH